MTSSYTLYVYNNTYTLSTSTKLNNSMPLYDKNILLYSGVDNKTNFKIVTDNNIPKDLSNLTIHFNVTDIENGQTVISKTMTVSDALRGEAYVEVAQNELYSIGEGYYNFTVYTVDSSQNQNIVYTDRSGDIQGVVEIKNSGLPKTRETQTADSFTSRTVGGTAYYYSGNLSGSSSQNLTASNHTVAVYTTGFTGNVQVEGNLNNTASTDDNDWFPILMQGQSTADMVYSNVSGATPYFFTSNVKWIRVRYLPDTSNTGTFDKMLLRN